MRRSVTALLVGIGVVVTALLALALWARFTTPAGEAVPALSGQRTTRSYDLTGFSGIDTRGQWQVTVVRGDAWAVDVTYPVGIERVIEVRKERDALTLRYTADRSWWSDFGSNEAASISARIVMPALEAVHLSGASSLDLSGFEGERLSVDGSGAVSIDGRDSRYRALALHLSGAGRADLGGVTTTDARIDVSGVHTVTLRMTGGSLSGRVSGVSRIDYFGTVSSQDIHTSGLARVEHRD